jgi:hypothetical protein
MAGKSKRAPNATARVMKAIGYLTDPGTMPGKAFAVWEKGMTRVMDRLARSDTYLALAGGMMEQGFRAQAQAIGLAEDMLRAMRLPTASDVIDVREQLRDVSEQVEALSAELEVAVAALERIEKKLAAEPGNGGR